jgi:signal transduction histidine kinase
MVLRFSSITARIITLHIMAVGLVSISLPLVLYWMVNAAAANLHQRALREHAESIASFLTTRDDGSLSLELPARLRQLYANAYGRYAYAVLDEGGRILFSSLPDRTSIFREIPHAPSELYAEFKRAKATMFGASIPKDIAGRTIRIQVAQDLDHRDVLIDDIVADFFKRVGWITIPILLVLLLIDIVIFRRALHPLIQASERAQTITPSSTHVRLPTAQIPTEILPLVVAVNRALERLDDGFRVQREFTADAAHELRTPLTILRTRVDTLADQEVAAALRDDVSGMTRIVSQLLEIAELAALVVDPQEKSDLRNVCADVVEAIAPLALAQGKEIGLAGCEEPVWVKGNPEALYRAIRNLAENAVHHTPAGTQAEIVVSKTGSVSVRDEGPGVPEQDRELIFQRFWRRDRRRAGSAGLGLSIVRQIIDANAGTICVSNRPHGGAQFDATFVQARSAT